jgi:hypothetical protein
MARVCYRERIAYLHLNGLGLVLDILDLLFEAFATSCQHILPHSRQKHLVGQF